MPMINITNMIDNTFIFIFFFLISSLVININNIIIEPKNNTLVPINIAQNMYSIMNIIFNNSFLYSFK